MMEQKDRFLYRVFEQTAKKCPNQTAIVCGGRSLTYQQLAEKVDMLAFYLHKRQVEGGIVAILLERSLEVAVSILATMKLGKTYMTIDPNFPEDRIRYMLQNSQAAIMLASGREVRDFGCERVDVRLDNREIYHAGNRVAFAPEQTEEVTSIIYTSGSTGNPKGVMVKNSSLQSFYQFVESYFGFYREKERHVGLSVTSICFDVFIAECLCPLVSGITIVMATHRQLNDSMQLNQLAEKHRITLFFSPIHIILHHMQNLPSGCAFSRMEYIVQAGEKFRAASFNDIQAFFPSAAIYNAYGPTEATVYVTIKKISSEDQVNIGRPLSNATIYLLDEQLGQVPEGEVGQIFVGGECLAKGYLGAPELTAEKYIPNPYHENERIYQTGDLGYLLPNGDLQYVDRIDNQVKINGVRMELSEIEDKVLEHELVDQCVVVNDDNKLTAFVTKKDPTKRLNINELKEILLSKLPISMVPVTYIILPEMPSTSNGKIDRNSKRLKQALNDFHRQRDEKNQWKQQPRNEIEKQILKVVKQVLKFDIGINQSIFDFGANSLLVFDMTYQINELGYRMNPIDLYRYPSVKELFENKLREFHKADLSQEHLVELVSLKGLQNKQHQPHLQKDFLLTGSTGYLGNHVLAELLYRTDSVLYCCIRGSSEEEVRRRFVELLHYYHGDQWDKLIGSRIRLLAVDFQKKDFGLDKKTLLEICERVSDVVNCAANVKYFNNQKEMESANVLLVESLMEFCIANGKKLHHMSTLSVLDYMLLRGSKESVDEYTFYDCDSLDPAMQKYLEGHIYIDTKLRAERAILKGLKRGLFCHVYRLGNLCARKTDHLFQKNESDNAFYNFVRAIEVMGALPKQGGRIRTDITNIDLAASAICRLICSDSFSNFRLFHIMNPNTVCFSDLLSKKVSGEIDDLDEFFRLVSQKNQTRDITLAMMFAVKEYFNDMYLQKPDFIDHLNNQATEDVLQKLGFEWGAYDASFAT